MVAPNAACDEIEEGGIVYSRLQALKDIPKDSEITINYGALWFASRKKK
jgi:SET domain-containing protein